MSGKAIRLSKVARELNVGTSTIIEFLNDKGYSVASNPNTKLESSMYELLLEKFQPDMLVKRKKEEALAQAEKDRAELFGKEAQPKTEKRKYEEATEEDVVLIKSNMAAKEQAAKEAKEAEEKSAPATPAQEAPKAEEKPKVEEPPKEPVAAAEPTKEEAPKQEEVKVEKQEEAPKAEEKPSKEEVPAETVVEKKDPVVEKAPEPAEKAPEAKDITTRPGLKVLGKIEIPENKPKAKSKPAPKKEEAPKAPEEAPKAPAAEATPEQTPEASAEVKEKASGDTPTEANKAADAPQAATPAGDDKETPKEGVDHSWKDKREELKGLTVLGKIEIKEFKPKKKKADEADEKKKRKRKRITASKAVSSTDDKDKLVKASRDSQDRHGRPSTNQRGPGGGQGQNQRKRGKRPEKAPVDDKQIQNQIKETLNRLTNKDAKGNKTKIKKRKKELQRQRAEDEKLEQVAAARVIEVTEFITANELANMMDVSVTEVITACMSLGMMVSINQRIDAETISVVAEEFGYEVAFKEVEMDEPSLEEPDVEERVVSRPPIVTIMGHVDHGKTSLLDFIRKTNVIAGEAGGITQHIGAYEVELEDGKKITFLDTPGHEAFTAMRARGAKVTDVVIIVIAADDKVMPQTKEAIAHSQAAGVPIVFAFNKIDRESANVDLIKQQLADENILVEEWGGKYQSQEISAKQGLHIDELLEKVLLEAELLELKADPEKRAVGTVIEATLDKGRGIVSTVLVQSGKLRVGDNMLAGAHYGKVKAMFNERGKKVKEAGPSTPVQILGFSGAPTSGDRLYMTKTEGEAKQIADDRSHLIREQKVRSTKRVTIGDMGRRIAIGNFKELNLIVKGDVDGSVEALSDSLLKLSTEEIQVNVIHKGVGQISESDVNLAMASDAVIIGFQVRPSMNARNIADKEDVEIRLYSIIYDAIDELKSAMEGMLEPTTEEKVAANIEVRETFRITKVGTIAGCMVLKGKVKRDHKIRVIRDGIVKHEGALGSLKRFKDDVKEVGVGYECGLQVEKYNDIEVGDIIEAYELIEVKRKLK